jgi:hypothetical protein
MYIDARPCWQPPDKNKKMARLVIPPPLRAEVNPHSGFLNPDSRYGHKSIKGLFFTPENQEYLLREVHAVLLNTKYVQSKMRSTAAPHDGWSRLDSQDSASRARTLTLGFTDAEPLLRQQMGDLMRAFYSPLNAPQREDFSVANPILQLHDLNKQFVLQTSDTFIYSPQTLIAHINEINPETGQRERPQYDYSAESWQDGTWHPEHLFTQSDRNRANPYWKPLEVDFDANPENRARGPGHRYNAPFYAGSPTGTPPRRNAAGQAVSASQFPIWQYTPSIRPYSHDQSSLREGGDGDRRVQGSRGYNTASLRNRSTY